MTALSNAIKIAKMVTCTALTFMRSVGASVTLASHVLASTFADLGLLIVAARGNDRKR